MVPKIAEMCFGRRFLKTAFPSLAERPVIRWLRRIWQIRTGRVETPFDGGGAFWMLSFVLHLVLILCIARLVLPVPADPSVRLSAGPESETLELVDLEQMSPEIEFIDSVEPEPESESELMDQVRSDFESVVFSTPVEAPQSMPVGDLDALISESGSIDFGFTDLPGGSDAFAKVAANGSAGTAVAAASGAIDRISEEIILSLESNKTLVVWLFDQSGSLLEQRAQILKRLDKVYRDLHASGLLVNQDDATLDKRTLLTDVISFGSDVTGMLKRASSDEQMIRTAMEQITLDETGVENVMAAVVMAANKYRWMHKIDSSTGKRKRNIMLIIVSDEAGDDHQRTDLAVSTCRENQIPVYVIGVPAPFGRQKTEVKWVDPNPDYDQTPQVAYVRQGPESLMPERLQLDLTGNVDDLEMIDSGFGPFDLTRLCFETGGIYFAVHPNRRTTGSVGWSEVANNSAFLRYFFDSDVMREYRPDYVSAQSYQKAVRANRARAALVNAAAFTSAGTLLSPRLRFPKFDEASFVNDVTRAQRDAAVIEPKLDQLYDIIKTGEDDRPLETSPRWRAGFDLAIGQALSAKIRGETYNMMLAMVKTSLKFDPPKGDRPQNNTWVLRPAEVVSTGSRSEKLAEKARVYLQRVVDEHPGTPWAMVARRELDTPIGWKWRQTYTQPPEMVARSGNNPTPQRRQRPMTPRRDPPNL